MNISDIQIRDGLSVNDTKALLVYQLADGGCVCAVAAGWNRYDKDGVCVEACTDYGAPLTNLQRGVARAEQPAIAEPAA